MENKKDLYWIAGLIIIVMILSFTVIWVNYNSWTVRFEMDDNTLEAIESIEYPIVENEQLELKHHVGICRIYNDSTADCSQGAINPDVIEIYDDGSYKFIFVDQW